MKKLVFIFLTSLILTLIFCGVAFADSNYCTVSVDSKYDAISSSAVINCSSDLPNLSLFRLEYAPKGTSNWTQIASSAATSPFSLSSVWQTGAISEGDYELRLTLEHSDGTSSDSSRFIKIDRTRPSVVSTSPKWGSKGVDPGSSISITFSETINKDVVLYPSNIFLRLSAGSKVACTSAYDGETNTLILTPLKRLKEFTKYTVQINSIISDLAGNSLDKTLSVNFETKDATKPQITFFRPKAGLKTDGIVSLAARIKDNIAVKKVLFLIDSHTVKIEKKVNQTYFASWNSYGSKGGRHSFKVIVEDYFSNNRTLRRSFVIRPRILTCYPKPKRISPDGNKVNDIAKINIKLNTPCKITAYIISQGKLLKFLCKDKSFKYGINSIKWDGKDIKKRRVHNGFYRYSVYVKNKGGVDKFTGTIEVKVGLKLEIDGPVSLLLKLSERKLYLLSGKRVVSSYSIAVGRPGWRTPRGWFRVVAKQFNPTWYPPKWSDIEGPVYPGPHNPLGPRRLLFTWDGYGIHGTNKPSSIGHAVSHGCVRMNNWAILEIFPVVPLGAPIHIVN